MTKQRKGETREAYLERVREFNQSYYARNRGRVLARKRIIYAVNPEKMRARARAYRAANLEKYREAARVYREANREVRRQSTREWRSRIQLQAAMFLLGGTL